MRLQILIFAITTLWFSIDSYAQEKDSLNYGPEPQGGINGLALHYFKIDFTKKQRLVLGMNEIELIYSVTRDGKASLEKVNDLEDPEIIDSLILATERLPLFQPQVVDGKSVPAIYFVKLRFPTYTNASWDSRVRVDRPGLSDYKDIELGRSLDMLIGGVVNTFTGNAQDYLKTGGGMKVDIIFMGEKKFGAGMVMSFYGNKSKQDYPINSTRPQIDAPPTLFIGLAGQWVIDKKEKKQINFQFEANYIQQNLNTRIDPNDNNWDRFSGFSPGILVHYMIKLGHDHLSSYYWSPVVLNHWLNFHVGIRPLIYNSALPNGVMLETGVSYRMKTSFIKSYALKD
jgi:hypothetical protein